MEKRSLPSSRSSSNIKLKQDHINTNIFIKKIEEKLKNSQSSTPTKPKQSFPQKPSCKKPPKIIRSPKKSLNFDSTSLDLNSLKQLQTFSSTSQEKIIKLKQKLKGSKMLINKYQAELITAYQRIAELESIVHKCELSNSYESTKQIFNK